MTAIQLVRASATAPLALPTSKEQPRARGTPASLPAVIPTTNQDPQRDFQADTRSR